MKKILITGSEGFIGSHLVEHLIQKKYKINALVLYNSFNSKGWLDDIDHKVKNKIKIFNGDIRDTRSIEESIKGCNIVINLAALIGIPYSYTAAQSYVDTNVQGTLNLLNLSLKHKISKFIHTSTSEVYGSAQFVPIDEKHPLVAQSPYAATKIAADQLVDSFNKSFGLSTTILRPFNTFGPRQSLRAVIPTIIIQALKSNKILLGNVYSRRDFTFVSETVEAYEKALKTNKCIGQTINLGTNKDYSIEEIIKLVGKILKKKIYIKKDLKRYRPKKSEVDRLLSNNNKAKKILKWLPRSTNEKYFIEYLRQTIDWYKKNNLSKNSNSKDYVI
jgi:NAD dependent epimerase/dehydratase